MTTPASARMEEVIKAIPGVGSGPRSKYIHPHGADAGGHGIFQEIAGEAGVLAHHDAVPARGRT